MFSGGSDDFLGGDPDVTFFTAVYDAGTREKLSLKVPRIQGSTSQSLLLSTWTHD